MIYSKNNPPKGKMESISAPIWANPSHAEEVRVDPSKARTMSEIINRYTAGVIPREVNNGEIEYDKDPSEFSSDEIDSIFDSEDCMGADIIDINEYKDVQEQVARRIEKNRSTFAEVLRKHSKSKDESTEE